MSLSGVIAGVVFLPHDSIITGWGDIYVYVSSGVNGDVGHKVVVGGEDFK